MQQEIGIVRYKKIGSCLTEEGVICVLYSSAFSCRVFLFKLLCRYSTFCELAAA